MHFLSSCFTKVNLTTSLGTRKRGFFFYVRLRSGESEGAPLFFSAPRVRCANNRRRELRANMVVYPKVSDPVEVPDGTPSGTLFVSVDGTYKKNGCPANLEDCARGYWTVANLEAAHAYNCDWLMSRKNGKINGVWRIDRKKGWMDPSATPKVTWPSDQPKDRPRLGCELIKDEKMEKLFIGQVVHLGRCYNSLRGYFK